MSKLVDCRPLATIGASAPERRPIVARRPPAAEATLSREDARKRPELVGLVSGVEFELAKRDDDRSQSPSMLRAQRSGAIPAARQQERQGAEVRHCGTLRSRRLCS